MSFGADWDEPMPSEVGYQYTAEDLHIVTEIAPMPQEKIIVALLAYQGNMDRVDRR
jgi:hypothetical protein